MKRILCYGDSNTYGYDPRSYFGARYPKNVRWTGRLMVAGYEVVNEGQNGREIPARGGEVFSAINMIQNAFPLDVIVIMLGGNDLLQHPSFRAEDVTARMERFLRELQSHVSECCYLLVAPPPMQWGEWVMEQRLIDESARLSACFHSLARSLRIDYADAGQWNVELAFDGVLFSEAGHTAFADGLLRCLPEKGCQQK